MRSTAVPRLAGIALLASAFFVTGCSKPTTISGRVTKGGEPLHGGTISFVSTKDTSVRVTSPIDPKDGSYTVRNVPAGEVKILIDNEYLRMVQPQAMKKMQLPPGASVPTPPGGQEAKYVPLPSKYRDPAKTDLIVTVKKGKNNHDVTLP